MRSFVTAALLTVCLGLGLGCTAKTQTAGVSGGTGTGEAGYLGKYEPAITYSTARQLNNTILFDQNISDRRSLDENIWARTFREDLGINITHSWIAPDGDSNTAKWNAAMASGDVPDFATVSQNVSKLLYDAGLCYEMDEIVEQWASPELKALIPQDFYEQLTIDGKLVGLPLPAKAAQGATLLFIRTDWLDQLGLPLPKSVEDVMSIARAFRDAKLGGPNTIGIMFGQNTSGGTTGSLAFGSADGKWDGFLNGYGAYLNYWIEKDGELAYSTIQPELRPALLALRSLYREGVMNRDFAAINNQVAQEYITSGRVGIFYMTAWNVSSTIQTLHNLDPKARVINMFPPGTGGRVFSIQTNTPRVLRVFVSAKTKNPEAVVKLANMTVRYMYEDYGQYISQDGFRVYKYLPWGDFLPPVLQDMGVSNAIRTAERNGGGISNIDSDDLKNWPGLPVIYENYLLAKEGKQDIWYLETYGEGGEITTLHDAMQDGKLLFDAYNGQVTDTMALKGDIITTALHAAMFDVVQGADISVWDRAVQKWLDDGGAQIIREVKDWYKSVRR
jgi:putative aldouronate transport system substrate-binding protein